MKTNQLTRSQATTLSIIIANNAEIVCGIAVIEIAAGILQNAGIQNIATEAIRAAYKNEKQLETLLRSGGWEIRHGEIGKPLQSPLVRTLVEIGTPLPDSLDHVGAVGEGSMPDGVVQGIQRKPVTGGKKPVTDKLGEQK